MTRSSRRFSRFQSTAAAAAALLALAFGAGCWSGVNDKVEQSVDFKSVPTNATVKIDGASIGRTPVSAVLSKLHETHVLIEKPGFIAADLYVRPRDGDLEPNPVDVKLKAEIIPDSPGSDPQAGLARGLEVTKQYIEMGRVMPEDQQVIEIQLREFYTPAK